MISAHDMDAMRDDEAAGLAERLRAATFIENSVLLLDAADRIEALEAENKRLREVIRTVLETDDHIKRGEVYRDDGVHSKHDTCVHGLPVYNGCEACVCEYLGSALTASQRPTDAQDAPSGTPPTRDTGNGTA